MIKCPYCNKEIKEIPVQCNYCGGWVSEQSVTSSASLQPKSQQFSNVMPAKRFIFLCIFSFGIYELLWFYNNWKFIRERDKLKISPLWRAIFAVIFIYPLSKRIFALAEEKGYKKKHSPGLIAICYIAICMLYRLPDPIWLISVLSFVPLLTLLEATNHYWENEQSNLEKRTNPSKGEIVILVIGIILWALTVLGILFPE